MNGLLGRIQVLILLGQHRWLYLLGILSLGLGLVGISVDSPLAIATGGFGAVIGLVAVVADRRTFLRSLRAMQISEVPRSTWADLSPSPQVQGWVRQETCTSPVILSPAVDDWLHSRQIVLPELTIANGEPQVEILERPFELHEGYAPDPLASYYVLRERTRGGRDVKNDRKVRLVNEPIFSGGDCAPAAVQNTGYFDGVLTNEFARFQILQRGSSVAAFRGIDSCASSIDSSGTRALLPLSKSHASNHVGVSMLLFTADDSLVIQIQGDRANQSAGKRVPCASGSMDWSDVAAGLGLVALVCRAAVRELEEETSLTVADLRSIQCLGMYRTLERGGKPEFTFLARAVGDEAILRRKIAVRREERRYVHGFEYWDLNQDSEDEALARHHHEWGDSLSPSLDAALHLLERSRRVGG